MWTTSLPEGPALSHLAGQHLLCAMRKAGTVTDICATGQSKSWVTLGKKTVPSLISSSLFPREMGTILEFEKIRLGYPHLKTHSP